MFLLSLYWLLSPVLWILLPVFAIFNPKIRHHWLHERSSWKEALIRRQEIGDRRKAVLFHAASAGEFEQIKPILNKMDRESYFILLTFFSPTIYLKEKDTSLADAVCYHPFDFPWSAWFFFRKMEIQYYIITRNDIWPTHLYFAKKMGISTALINANIYRDSHYKSRVLQGIIKQILVNFDLICTGSERLKNNLLQLVPSEKVKVTGDSRLDQVLARKTNSTSNQLPNTFRKSKTLLLGSIIPSDFPVIFSGIKQYYSQGQQSLAEKNQRMIIVPHEVGSAALEEIENQLNRIGIKAVHYSKCEDLEEYRVVIVDMVGILAELYAYSDIAYVGAGFGAGVHSVLEPAVYSNHIGFGPNYQIVDMAVTLTEMGLSQVINNGDDFNGFLTLLEKKEELSNIQGMMEEFINNQNPAAELIIENIFSND